MTTLEKFVAFAEALPAARRREMEEHLESLMHPDEGEFTAAELAELDRRLADPDPKYADPADVEAIFSRYRKS